MIDRKRVITWTIYTLCFGLFGGLLVYLKIDAGVTLLLGWLAGTLGGLLFVDEVR